MTSLISARFVLPLFLVFGFLSNAEAIKRFKQVDENLYRGSAPITRQDLQELKKAGITFVVNLMDRKNDVQKEERTLKETGITMVNVPFDVWGNPSQNDVEEVLGLLVNEQADHKVFVHCAQGKDRTGMIIGLYRVHVQNWNADKAYDEMLAMDFDPQFKGLKNFFWNHSHPGDLRIPDSSVLLLAQ